MEIIARKMCNSVGMIFPKDISPKVGEIFTILKVGEVYILNPKKAKDLEDFRDSFSTE